MPQSLPLWPCGVTAILAYLLGSIPFGLVLTRLAGLGDIRSIGSGNIGATNVLRTGNRTLAAATLVLDAGKGALAVLIADAFGPELALIAAGAAMLGHLFPVWLDFRGGKGVATGVGILLALSWPVGLLATATWLFTAWRFHYSSLAAIVACALAPVYALFLADRESALFIALICGLVIYRHRGNIARLRSGEESRIGSRG